MSDLHPPKREIFDVPAMTNTDNKGFVRPVDRYEETAFGLYMSRTADHPRFSHLESWLLPALGLRANIFHFVDGHRTGQRLYLDIGRFQGPDTDGRWQVTVLAEERDAAALETARTKAMDELARIKKDGEAGEDDVKRAEHELDGLTKRFVEQIDAALSAKEAELLEV